MDDRLLAAALAGHGAHDMGDKPADDALDALAIDMMLAARTIADLDAEQTAALLTRWISRIDTARILLKARTPDVDPKPGA